MPNTGVNTFCRPSPGFARVELDGSFATVAIFGADGQVRQGVLADGTSSPLQRTFLAD